jgi:O-antigen/teichoic acid export membrane protein
LTLSVTASVVIGFAARFIFAAYGPQFISAQSTLNVLLLSGIISGSATIFGQAIASAGRMWGAACLNVIWGLLLLTTASSLVPRYGGFGLGLALLVAYIVHGTLILLYTVHLSQPMVLTLANRTDLLERSVLS